MVVCLFCEKPHSHFKSSMNMMLSLWTSSRRRRRNHNMLPFVRSLNDLVEETRTINIKTGFNLDSVLLQRLLLSSRHCREYLLVYL